MTFGKTLPGSEYWYVASNNKYGTLFHTDGETVDTIIAYFRNHPTWDLSLPLVRAYIYDAFGKLLIISDEIQLTRDPIDTEFYLRDFHLPYALDLPFGDYYLTLHVGGYGAIQYNYEQKPTAVTINNEDDYTDGPSDPFSASGTVSTRTKEFTILAQIGSLPRPPIAKFTVEPTSPLVGDVVTFDASESLDGWNGSAVSPIVSRNWMISGSPKSGEVVSVTFITSGYCEVILTVQDEQGLTNVAERQIYVADPGDGNGEIPEGTLSFEMNGEFELGLAGLGDKHIRFPTYEIVNTPPAYWSRGGWPLTQAPGTQLFYPELDIVHSGNRAARIGILDASTNVSRRLEILKDLDPINDKVIEQSLWYYLPSETMPLSPGQGVNLYRMIYERFWWDLPTPYQQFNIAITVWCDARSATKGQLMFLLYKLQDTDNEDTGIAKHVRWNTFSNGGHSPEVDPSGVDLEVLNKVTVPLDQWFKIRSRVVRDLVDGMIQVWVDLGEGEILLWDLKGLRTIGVLPERLTWGKPNETFLAAGFGAYYDIGDPPRSFVVDDFTLTTTPISPIELLIRAALSAATGVGLILLSL